MFHDFHVHVFLIFPKYNAKMLSFNMNYVGAQVN